MTEQSTANADIRVVVADDTDNVREMLACMLEIDGFQVVGAAPGGAEAVDLVFETEPDVLVIDYKMPGVDGLTATRRIRERYPDLPVILYTAYLDAQLEREAEQAGVNLCLGKVEGLATLEDKIVALCHRLASAG